MDKRRGKAAARGPTCRTSWITSIPLRDATGAGSNRPRLAECARRPGPHLSFLRLSPIPRRRAARPRAVVAAGQTIRAQLLPYPTVHVIFIGFLLVWRHSLSRREHIRAEKQGPVSTARSSAQRFRPRQHVQTVPVVYKQAAVGANLRIRNFNPGRSASAGSLTGPKLIGCVVGSGSNPRLRTGFRNASG